MKNIVKSVSLKSMENDNYLSISRANNMLKADDNNLNTLFDLIQISPSNVIIRLQNGRYITVDEKDNTLKANVLDMYEASVFRLKFITKKEVSLKCDNGHYVCVDDDILKANEYQRTSKSTFTIKQLASEEKMRQHITIYEHENYQGKAQSLGVGSYNVNELTIGNDTLSSLKVPKGLVVTLYENANFYGKKMKITQDTPYVGDEFNDKTSSIKVESVKERIK